MKSERKLALVTGAGQGIGKEICRKLQKDGFIVILNDADEILANKAANDIGENVYPYTGDVSDPKIIAGIIEFARSTFGKIDVLIANAGITEFGDFFEFQLDDFMKMIKVNLAGTFFLTQSVASLMREEKSGNIVLMSSVTGMQAHKHLTAYSMTKAALMMMAKNLVIELSPFNININCVAPGAILTERTLSDDSYAQTWSTLTPLGRPGTVSDVANTVSFLVSEGAKHITGQTIVIDGGWSSVSPNP
jgi:glucose 1-dehydrogenase